MEWYETSFVGLCVWVLGPQLVALFSEAVGSLEVKARRQKWAGFREDSSAPSQPDLVATEMQTGHPMLRNLWGRSLSHLFH